MVVEGRHLRPEFAVVFGELCPVLGEGGGMLPKGILAAAPASAGRPRRPELRDCRVDQLIIAYKILTLRDIAAPPPGKAKRRGFFTTSHKIGSFIFYL
jgi:hypothetical protein